MVVIGKKTQIVGEPFIDFDFEEFRSMAPWQPIPLEVRHAISISAANFIV